MQTLMEVCHGTGMPGKCKFPVLAAFWAAGDPGCDEGLKGLRRYLQTGGTGSSRLLALGLGRVLGITLDLNMAGATENVP